VDVAAEGTGASPHPAPNRALGEASSCGLDGFEGVASAAPGSASSERVRASPPVSAAARRARLAPHASLHAHVLRALIEAWLSRPGTHPPEGSRLQHWVKGAALIRWI
jgi:hypothetical protein